MHRSVALKGRIDDAALQLSAVLMALLTITAGDEIEFSKSLQYTIGCTMQAPVSQGVTDVALAMS